MNLIDVTRELATDEQCLAFLEHQRWPDGIVRCPTCGNDQISRITRKTASKNKRAQVYQCLESTCKQQFSATNGSIFHDSHLPLNKWFMAIALVMDAKKGISAKQLQQHLGIGSYKTAWYMCHRIRKAMVDADPTPLSGVVEIDETYIGGNAIRRFQKTPKPRPPKDMVLAMRERSTKDKPGRVRYFHVPDGKLETLKPIVEANVADFPSMKIYTDSSSVYDIMFGKGPREQSHRMVNHSREWVVPGSRIHTNTVESSFSLLKRGLIGSFHRVSIKHLHRYLTEFEYRFNQRKADDRFTMTVAAMLRGKPMPFKQLVSEA
ncbi:MAG TPA: IS1595 family transposase [Acidobacteriaceae bacterium]|nr:IS1595 family transposase [Acidobacteriaceae bacterium]